MDRYVITSIEERLNLWREAERAACDAEAEVANLGQAASDPRTRDLFIKAGKLRNSADRQYAAILRAVRLGETES